MAGVLNFSQLPLFRPPLPRRPSHNRVRIMASKDPSETTSTSTRASPEDERQVRVSSSRPPQPFSSPPDFRAPKQKPKLFSPRSDKIFDILGASVAVIFRFGTGVFVSGHSASWVPKTEIPPGQYALDVEVAGYKLKETSKLGPRPERPVEIYEFEGCPFCRKVREIVAVLDLDVLFYPCPKNGPNFRPKVAQMGGKQLFPYMVDPNTGVKMYESDGIIKYLVGKYGDGRIPFMLSLGLLTNVAVSLAMISRIRRGTFYSPSKLPPKPLEIWAYEGSPFCKIVREALVELELPHIYRSCARGSPKRQMLYERAGLFLVPYLEDPNTGVQMFESADIVDYLRATYAVQ